jgi:hypothetical protein
MTKDEIFPLTRNWCFIEDKDENLCFYHRGKEKAVILTEGDIIFFQQEDDDDEN